MELNQAGKSLILSFEALKLSAYQDSGGIWTIGVGATGPGIVAGTIWTKDVALARFDADIEIFQRSVEVILGATEVGDNQFAALVSFAYNVGRGNFAKSTLLKLLKGGDVDGAADQFLAWNKDEGEVLAGLTRRRQAERALFLTPDIESLAA